MVSMNSQFNSMLVRSLPGEGHPLKKKGGLLLESSNQLSWLHHSQIFHCEFILRSPRHLTDSNSWGHGGLMCVQWGAGGKGTGYPSTVRVKTQNWLQHI
jgi:hypothetical protein